MNELEALAKVAELKKAVDEIREPWVETPYYANAEKWTYLFWEESGPFKRLYNKLSKGTMIELASGHGRHAEHSAKLAESLILVDVIEENLSICRERLKRFQNVSYRIGEGMNFPGVKANSIDSIYCYDAMVHFSPEIVDAYIDETVRVLKKGRLALYHHSNYAEGKDKTWSHNPGARNYMTAALFSEMAERAGLKIVEQVVISWGGVPELDCISLVEKV